MNCQDCENWKPKYRSKCLDCAKEHLYPDCDSGYIGKHVNSRIITTCQHFERIDLDCVDCVGWVNNSSTKRCGPCTYRNRFEQKTCETCHWGKMGCGLALIGQGSNALSNGKCSWKPIEEPCPTCGETGEVCTCHGVQKDKCEDGRIEGKYLIHCPACQPKEEVLLMPVRWVYAPGLKQYDLYLIKNKHKRIACVYLNSNSGKYNASIFGGTMLEKCKIISWDTPEQAQAAVEKALGIRKVN